MSPWSHPSSTTPPPRRPDNLSRQSSARRYEMEFVPTAISEVVLVEPRVFGDSRGYFLESWEARKFACGGLDLTFCQDNENRSARNVLRGLHYQLTRPQGKLVRVVTGA